MKIKILCGVVGILLFVWAGAVLAQTENQAFNLIKEGQTILDSVKSKDDYQRAVQKFEEALKIGEKVKSDKLIGIYFNQLGIIQSRFGHYQKALEYYEKSLAISKKIGNLKEQGTTRGNIGAVYISLGQYTKALDYNEQSLAIRKKIGDVRGEGANLNNIALAYRYLGDYARALEYYEKSLAIRQKIGAEREAAATLDNIGSVYSSMGHYSKATETYQKALASRKKVGDVRGEGVTLNNIGRLHDFCGEPTKALEYYEKALTIFVRIGDLREEGNTLKNKGLVYSSRGEYASALEIYEQSLDISRKIGDVRVEGINLTNIGRVCCFWGEYTKALEHFEKSLTIFRNIGDVKEEGISLDYTGQLYVSWGQHAKALETYENSLTIAKRIGDNNLEGDSLRNIGATYVQMGKFDDALTNFQKALEIYTRIGVPLKGVKNLIGNLYLDRGDLNKSEALIKETGYDESLARLYLLQSDYPKAKTYYDKLLTSAEKNQNVDNRFTAYSGLGKVHEALEDYKKSEEYYEKGMTLTEEIRSGLLPSERKNFFEVRINGFYRSEPAKGLTRVRMKLNQAAQSVDSSEVTRARTFSDNMSLRSESGFSGIPKDVLEKEDSLVTKVAALKKELVKTDKEKQPGRYENLQKEIHSAESDLNAFTKMLWDKHKAYAAVKYPRPVTLKESSLKPEEFVVVFDVSTEGVGVKLIKDKKIAETHYTNWKSEDLERDVKKFRQSFEELKLKEFDYSLGITLYKRLLSAVLSQVSEGTPLVIIPDGILATLPFEALVTGGKPNWKKVDKDWPDALKDYPEGLTFLGDEHPISYYQSITALTLARTTGAKNNPNQRLLVIADPVFDLSDKRAQSANQTKLSEQDKKKNIALMQTIEDSAQGTFKLSRLPRTSELADNLEKMYGSKCLSLTGLKANKSDFLTKIAPGIEQYSGVVFATHGVISTHVPGLMEPFLALTMAPSGTDGFLKMSDVLSLKMNAEIVALTACQTGLGKELSGEGIMSMGRAFQYAGAKSVLMSLWSVSEAGSVLLVEKFFQHLKAGKTKLESLKSARDDIRNDGYKHPFFWSAFILVGEVN
jgi:tetratricopeptide (TPR) repeat protein